MDYEISSTEKLLDTIRGVQRGEKDIKGPAPRSGRGLGLKGLVKSGKKAIVIGVHIDRSALHLVKINPHHVKPQFMGATSIPLPEDTPQDSERFTRFIRDSLKDFIGPERSVQVWSFMSSADVEVARVVFPKLSRSQISNAVQFKAKKDMEYQENTHALDYRVQERFTDGGVVKTAVLISVVPREEVERIKGTFSAAGYELTGVTLPCFAFENLFKQGFFEVEGETAASLYIGNRYSRIDIFYQGNLHLTRWIRSGSYSLVGALVESAQERGYELTSEEAQNILINLESSETDRVMPIIPFSEEEVFEMMLPALDRIVKQLERTFEGYGSQVGETRVANLFVSGGPGRYWRIINYFEQQLGLTCGLLNPFMNTRAFEPVVLPPPGEDIQLKISAAVGLALSTPEATPNLTETYEDKEKAEKTGSAARYAFLASAVVLAIVFGIFAWQRYDISKKKSQLSGINAALKAYGQPMDQQALMQSAAKLASLKNAQNQKAARLLPVGVIKEVSRLTVDGVHLALLSFERIEGETPEMSKARLSGEKARKMSGTLLLEGVVGGEPGDQEAILTGWVLRLASSPIIVEPRVDQKNIETIGEASVLKFLIKAKVAHI